MEKLLSLEDIKNLPDGTLVCFISFGSFYGDKRFGIVEHADGIISFPESCEAHHIDNHLFASLKRDGIEFVDGKAKAMLYKEI